MQADTIVLGAGIVGVSTAIHLARRGRTVVLVDRRGPGEETSYGNAGLIQREGVLPYNFPQNLGKILKYGLNSSTDMHYHLRDLPGLAPFLLRYWWNSRTDSYAKISRLYSTLIAESVTEHADLIAQSGADDLIEKNGWYKLFRTNQRRDEAFAEADMLARDYGVTHEKLDGAGMKRVEPALKVDLAGVIHWQDPWTVKNPQQLVLRYLALFEKLGGKFISGDATTLKQSGATWTVTTKDGPVEAGEVVVALGPWANKVTEPLGYRLPLGVKRGYHMHYKPVDPTPLTHWMLDAEPGYLLAPMNIGIRLTTGAEFARHEAPQTPIQVERAEKVARELFPLGERIDPKPWMGARPATPDMMPIIGPAPRHKGLWFGFGHAHHGLTLGPATGRLLGEMMTGEAPFVDPTPFAATRFNP